ncbi:nuclease-related domain-containing protein [Neobacillus cucumis]|uniref:NERD nuclease n=1 Tax=Neobacillus cucumis TaxID=1740721 RepID=A0A2N5HJW8_9BACI|nr:nuclease-related domain-containing protein [Neobacillus cucumis]PLS05803.1 NERD nuclease [Neobacillus cucumis]
MFDLPLIKPITLQQAEAAQRRLPSNHPKMAEVEVKIRILASGYKGEKTLNYFLGLLPEKNHHIFQGLRLPARDSFFQMDAHLLSPRLIILLESKNYSGILTLEKHQLTQEINNIKMVYDNPISQVNRHKILLQYFFQKYQIPPIPIETVVVFTKSSAEVKVAQGYQEAEKKICKAGDLLKKIEELEKYYPKDRVDSKTVGKIKRLLLSKHTPYRADFLGSLSINKSDILPGVCCSNCLYMPMEYKKNKWLCPVCLKISKEGSLKAINDFFLLINTSITNSELREFLQLPTRRASSYQLELLNLPSTGTKKGRIYHLPNDFL